MLEPSPSCPATLLQKETCLLRPMREARAKSFPCLRETANPATSGAKKTDIGLSFVAGGDFQGEGADQNETEYECSSWHVLALTTCESQAQISQANPDASTNQSKAQPTSPQHHTNDPGDVGAVYVFPKSLCPLTHQHTQAPNQLPAQRLGQGRSWGQCQVTPSCAK